MYKKYEHFTVEMLTNYPFSIRHPGKKRLMGMFDKRKMSDLFSGIDIEHKTRWPLVERQTLLTLRHRSNIVDSLIFGYCHERLYNEYRRWLAGEAYYGLDYEFKRKKNCYDLSALS